MSTLNHAETYMKRKVSDFLHEKESYAIRGAAFEVWKSFKGVFKERVMEKAMEKELTDRGFIVESQKKIPIHYKDVKVGSYVPDLVVNNCVVVELKAKQFLLQEDERQFWYYLRGSPYRLGFLINFGPRQLEIRRRVYDRARERYKTIGV